MKLKQFMEMYDNWNGITMINDENLDPIVFGKTLQIMHRKLKLKRVDSYDKLFEMEVVAFGFYCNELCVRVR